MTELEREAVRLYVEEGRTQQEVMGIMSQRIEREKLRNLLTSYTEMRMEARTFVSPEKIKELTEEIRKSWTPSQAGRRWVARHGNSRERRDAAASQLLR